MSSSASRRRVLGRYGPRPGDRGGTLAVLQSLVNLLIHYFLGGVPAHDTRIGLLTGTLNDFKPDNYLIRLRAKHK